MKLIIKKIAFTFIIFAAQSICAQSPIQDCVDQARSNGDGNGRSIIKDDCLDHIKSAAKPLLNRSTSQVFAYDSMLYLNNDPRYLYAGSNTLIEEPISVRKEEKEVFLLTKKNGVLVFLDFLPGNVAPIRQVQSIETDFAVDLAVNHDNLYLLLKDQIVILDRQANDLVRQERQRTTIKERIMLNSSGAKAMALDSVNNQLYILYRTNILRLDLVTRSQEVFLSDPSLVKKTSLEFRYELKID